MYGLNLNRNRNTPQHMPPDPVEAQKTNRMNSRNALIDIWTNEKAEYKARGRDIRNWGYKVPFGLFTASSLIVALIAGISDKHGDKDILQLIGMGSLYTSGFILAVMSFFIGVITTKWGYRYFQHKKNSTESNIILGEDYFAARFKEQPPEWLWPLATILAFSLWYLITQLILLLPGLSETLR